MSALLPAFAEHVVGLSAAEVDRFRSGLTRAKARAILDSWDLMALPYQRTPTSEFRIWVVRCGRGAGKTYTGGKTTNQVAEDKDSLAGGDIAIIGRTHTDTRRNCIEGPSGILRTARADFMPKYSPGKGQVVWPNGVVGHCLSGDKPEGIRGTNAAWAWCDEVMHWAGDVKKTWDEALEPALRIGRAQCMITTTPLPGGFLRDLEARVDTVVTRGSTYSNPFLAPKALKALERNYAGTTAGEQELGGEILSESDRLLWSLVNISDNRIAPSECPPLERVVVAVDPAVSSNEDSDETGIVSAGIATAPDGVVHAYVKRDDTETRARPEVWAATACRAFRELEADCIVAEVNQGGDMVESTIRAVNRLVPYKGVHAYRGKVLRAEPVAALYRLGLVHHVGVLEGLERQQTTWIPSRGKSPDRVDALVYALTELMLGRPDPVYSSIFDAYSIK